MSLGLVKFRQCYCQCQCLRGDVSPMSLPMPSWRKFANVIANTFSAVHERPFRLICCHSGHISSSHLFASRLELCTTGRHCLKCTTYIWKVRFHHLTSSAPPPLPLYLQLCWFPLICWVIFVIGHHLSGQTCCQDKRWQLLNQHLKKAPFFFTKNESPFLRNGIGQRQRFSPLF
jgi:hypothetical protein